MRRLRPLEAGSGFVSWAHLLCSVSREVVYRPAHGGHDSRCCKAGAARAWRKGDLPSASRSRRRESRRRPTNQLTWPATSRKCILRAGETKVEQRTVN